MKYQDIQTYVRHVREQCQFVVMAHADLRQAAAHTYSLPWSSPTRVSDDASREMWFAAQALLSAIANVDKLLWDGDSPAAREPIRTALGVTDRSVGWKTARKIRNDFDHYDERIAEWVESDEGLKLEGLGPPPIVTGHTSKAFWRNYDPETDTLRFWDREVDLSEIETEARRLIPLAEDIEAACAECIEEGRPHPVTFPRDRGFPAGPVDT